MPVLDILPEILDFNGQWPALRNSAYQIFRRDFFVDGIIDGNLRVFVNSRRDDQGVEEGFHHITTRENADGKRAPDVDRTRRMGWIRPIVEHAVADVPGLVCWRHLEGSGEVRRYYWAMEDDFLVICTERRKTCDRLFLASAFRVTKYPKRRELEKKYQRRLD